MGEIQPDAATAANGRRTVEDLADLYQPPRSPETVDFLAALGRAVLSWNMAESIMRLMLECLAQEDGDIGPATLVALTDDLGGVTLENAIARLAPAVLRGERLADVKYAAKQFGRIRDYRNQYFHGLTHMETAPEAHGVIISRATRTALRRRYERVSVSDLEAFSRWCGETSAYTKGLIESWHPLVIDGEQTPVPTRPRKVDKCEKAAPLLPTSPFAASR